jgi:hypothetical protein
MRSVDASFSMHRLRLLLVDDVEVDDVEVDEVEVDEADADDVLGVAAPVVAALVTAPVDDGVFEPDFRVSRTASPDTTRATTTTPITARTVRFPPPGLAGPPAPYEP